MLIDWSVLAPATSRASRCSLCRSAASACLASVMSRAILEHPIILPAGSRNGEIVSETSMRSPALVTPDRFIMFDSLTGSKPPQNVVLLVVQLRRDDHRDRLSDRLVLRISEHPLGSGVPR